MMWLKNVVKLTSGVMYIPKNWREIIAQGKQYDVVYSQDSQCERLLQQYFGGIENVIACEYVVSLCDVKCSFLEPFESLEEADAWIRKSGKLEYLFLHPKTDVSCKKRYGSILSEKLHPSDVEKNFGIA